MSVPLDRDQLFVYRACFRDPALGDERWFCPYSAQVIGFLAYFPEVRATIDVVELDFPRPRAALVALLGEGNQAAPMLVLGRDAPAEAPPRVEVAQFGELRYVSKTIEILRYLAATRGVPGPH